MTAIKLFANLKPAFGGGNIGFNQRTAAAVRSQRLNCAGRTGSRLKKQGVQGVETGRFAKFIGFAQDIDAVADVFNGYAAAFEAADIMQSEGGQFHA
jgi:hypothetical protein